MNIENKKSCKSKLPFSSFVYYACLIFVNSTILPRFARWFDVLTTLLIKVIFSTFFIFLQSMFA